jgi:hypothetical protein
MRLEDGHECRVNEGGKPVLYPDAKRVFADS